MRRWRKHLTPILLIAAALGLGAYVYMDRESVTDSERALRERNVLPAFRRGDISRVELVQGAETLVLAREQGEWRILSPRQEVADVAAVDGLLRDLELASKLRTVPEGAPSFGAPRVTGTLTMGSVIYRFVLGGPAPSPEGASYLRLEGEGTFVVSKELTAALLRNVDAYRERAIVPYAAADVAKLEVRGPSGGFAVERANPIDFTLVGRGARASRGELDRVWGALGDMRAEAFPRDADADRAVDPPAFTIVLTPNDPAKPKGELVVGGECPGHPEDVVVVRRAPTHVAACVPRSVHQGLSVSEDALMDTRLFGARDDEVAELTMRTIPEGPVLDLARAGAGWRLRAPEDLELPAERADAATLLVQALTRAQGSRVRGGDAFEPQVRLTLVRAEGLGTEEVEVGPIAADGSAHVRRLADGAILRVSREIARKLRPRATAVAGPAIWSPPLDPVAARALRMRCDGVAQELTYGEKGWTLVEPPLPVDAAGAFDVVNVIARARAETWVADADDGSFGLPAPGSDGACFMSLTTGADGDVRTATLTFGASGEGGVYARADGPGVFVLPQAVRDAARRILVDRDVFGADPEAILSATLRGDGKTFRYEPDAGADEQGSAIADALGGLRAERVAHVGRPRADEGFQRPMLSASVRIRDDRGEREVRWSLGSVTEYERQKMVFARVEGIDATYLVAKERVAPLLDALR